VLPPRIDPTQNVENGSVVSYCPVASSFGARVLWEGGNAIDAAVATALALAVTYPQAGNLGGGGYMMIARKGGDVHFLDFRETAPRKVKGEAFIGPDGSRSVDTLRGAMSVAVPGTIAGLAAALQKFGSWGWDRILAPIIDLAETGVWLTTRQAGYLMRFADSLKEFESTRRCFMLGTQNYLPGSILRQPELGCALRLLASNGPDDFYKGAIARLITHEIARGGGFVDAEDLATYTPCWRDPIYRRFYGKDVATAALSSGGGLALSLSLGLMEGCGIDNTPSGSVQRGLLLARAFRVAFAIRHKVAADPDFLGSRELAEINDYLTRSLSQRDLDMLEKELVFPAPLPVHESISTTHFCVMDTLGNTVSCTYSLNTLFGSKLAVSGAGFLLNNSIDDFLIGRNVPNWYGVIDGPRNLLLPGRRPVGSMTPTVIRAADGSIDLAIGASGGPMIPTVIAQVISGMFVDGKSLVESLAAPRIHHQYQRAELQVEHSFPEDVIRGLSALGDPVVRSPRLAIGAGIHFDRRTKMISAALDPRFGQYR
jgi:gamma-glutamyltranspeptidase/glutathione hydrolase